MDQEPLSDGRPCSTDEFLVSLYDQVDDHYDRDAAINDWLHGDWDGALEGLTIPGLNTGKGPSK